MIYIMEFLIEAGFPPGFAEDLAGCYQLDGDPKDAVCWYYEAIFVFDPERQELQLGPWPPQKFLLLLPPPPKVQAPRQFLEAAE
jgi:hypothetical protein